MGIKRYRDYRMFWVSLILFCVFLSVGIYSLLIGNRLPMIGGFLLATIALFLLGVRYKNLLMDDAMVIYEWKVAAMLPSMIDYADIVSIEKKSQHVILLQHKRLSKIYVFNSDEFIRTYHEISDRLKK